MAQASDAGAAVTGCMTPGQTPTTSGHTSIHIGLFRGLLNRGGPQTKKLAYLYGIGVASIWLTIGLWVPIKPEWNVALALFLGAVTTGYVGGKKVGAAASPASINGAVSESGSMGAGDKIGGGNG